MLEYVLVRKSRQFASSGVCSTCSATHICPSYVSEDRFAPWTSSHIEMRMNGVQIDKGNATLMRGKVEVMRAT
jgi:hypothetical protein